MNFWMIAALILYVIPAVSIAAICRFGILRKHHGWWVVIQMALTTIFWPLIPLGLIAIFAWEAWRDRKRKRVYL